MSFTKDRPTFSPLPVKLAPATRVGNSTAGFCRSNLVDLLQDLHRALDRSSRGQLYVQQRVALILFGYETAGELEEQEAGEHHDYGEADHPARRVRHGLIDALDIPFLGSPIDAVEPVEDEVASQVLVRAATWRTGPA